MSKPGKPPVHELVELSYAGQRLKLHNTWLRVHVLLGRRQDADRGFPQIEISMKTKQRGLPSWKPFTPTIYLPQDSVGFIRMDGRRHSRSSTPAAPRLNAGMHNCIWRPQKLIWVNDASDAIGRLPAVN